MNKKITIAIDGHSGCGKSTTAREVARRLNYLYIDSGAMYRAVTLFFIENGIDYTAQDNVVEALNDIRISFTLNENTGNFDTCMNGKNIELDIRTLPVTEKVSPVSAIPAVRKAMVSLQRKLGQNKGVVMDGRDIGTVVFPDAELKVFMTADLKVRAERRMKELIEKGIPGDYDSILKNLSERDRIDSTRAESPLKRADGAFDIDTSMLKFEDQVLMIINQAKRIISGE